jgi:DNA modification methylase
VNKLLFGDNLNWLRDRETFPDASVDLIYLDPPFNSNRIFSVLFKSPDGHESEAQIEAFKDTWHWNQETEREFDEIIQSGKTDVAEMMRALRAFLGMNDMMAYLTMMANRLLELHRVLKPTGSLYLHCDPTASHYLKVVIDGVFGKENYQNEIIWKRTTTHSDSKTWSRVADTIFFYTKSDTFCWHTPREAHSEEYIETKYRHDDSDGRGLYRLDNMTSPNPRPNMMYEWKGFPFPEKGWRYSRETMARLDEEGRIWYPKKKNGDLDTTKRPQLKRYLNEMSGGVMGTIWTDISPVNSQAEERLGYPTQKPLALLERIISASSNEGDLVLDPFCGCGTAVHAAQKLRRNWIGIDITSFAISKIEDRLLKAFPEDSGTEGRRRLQYIIDGLPKDFEDAKNLAARVPDGKYQFQWWAVKWLVQAQPYQDKKKGADTGIDGIKYFTIYEMAAKVNPHKKTPPTKKTEKIIVSIKSGENVGPAMVKDLIATVAREKAEIGLFVTLARPTPAMVKEAASAGIYKTPSGKKYARIQLLPVEDLMNKTQRAEHPDYEPDVNYKAAQAESNAEQQHLV